MRIISLSAEVSHYLSAKRRPNSRSTLEGLHVIMHDHPRKVLPGSDFGYLDGIRRVLNY